MLRALAFAAGLWTAANAFAADGRVLPFSGRLVDDLGHPIAGQVDLSVNFFRSEAATDAVNAAPLKFAQVALADGVFHITLNLSAADVSSLFPLTASVAFLQVEDVTHHRTYRKHPVTQADLLPAAGPAVPVATTVPGPQVVLPGTAVNAATPLTGPSTTVPPPGAVAPPAVAPPAVITVAIAQATAGACLASPNIGAKFSVRNQDKTASCAATCAVAKSGSQCLRGWTVFAGDQVFEFGNECGTVQIMPNLPSQGRVCCCLAQSTPMPVFIDLPPPAQP